jgi:hypothetical protein
MIRTKAVLYSSSLELQYSGIEVEVNNKKSNENSTAGY